LATYRVSYWKNKKVKNKFKNHPAVKLGEFIKNQRIGAGLTLSSFCKLAKVRPSIMSELERGIGDHLTVRLYDEIQQHCHVDCETWKFEKLVMAAQKSSILEISDIYKKSDLLPAFPRKGFDYKKFDKFLNKMLKRKWVGKKRRIIMWD